MLYIPPTQNPFLMQSMNMLQNIGMMYLGHNLKQQDTEKQQKYQEEQRQLDTETKLALGGFRKVSPTEQMADVGNGPPPDNQITLPKVGTWAKPTAKPPKVFNLDIGNGRTVPIVQGEDGKYTVVDAALKDNTKQGSPMLQAFDEYKKTHPDATIEQFGPMYSKWGKQDQPSFGLSVDPATGQVNVTMGTGAEGAMGGVPLSPAAKNKAQTDVFDIDLSLQNLGNVAKLYKPEYQQMATKWQNALAAGKEKWLGQNLDPSEKQSLSDYTNYRKAAVGMYSEEIAKGGGKTLTPFEVKIYGGKLPNAGTGMFDGDSPTEFESGMKQMYSTLMKSKARMMWYQTQGLGAQYAKAIKQNLPADKAGLISLEDMDKVINNRAAQLERDLKMSNPTIQQPQLTELVKSTIQKEFFGAAQ